MGLSEVRRSLKKDRTNEFLTICRSIGTSPQVQGNSRLRQKSAFTKKCKLVGADITKTWGKLERLTQLCKSTTLFNDKPVEIQELTYIIKQEMDEMRFAFKNILAHISNYLFRKHLHELENLRANTGHQKDREKHDKSMVRTTL